MRTFLFATILLTTTSIHATVYQWQDANGNTVYGDTPPKSIGPVEIELPALTVADSYFSDEKKKPESTKKKEEPKEADKSIPYKSFSVKSPQKDDALRANNGNVMVQFDLKPALQDGHGLVVYLDGKQVASGSATVFSLKEVDRGEHSVFAVVHDANNDVLKNTEAVKFNVLRAARR